MPLSQPLPPSGSTNWYAHYADLDAQLRANTFIDNGAIPPAPTPTAGTRMLGHSYWTSALSSTASLASTSATFVDNLNFQARVMSTSTTPITAWYNPPYTTKTNDGDFGIPIAMVKPDIPLQSVYVADANKTTFQTQLDTLGGARIPDPKDFASGVVQAEGTDGTLILIYTDASGVPTGQEFEFWKFGPRLSTDPPQYQWRCMQGGYMANKATHPGIWSSGSSVPAGYNWGVSASGMSRLGVMLKAEDWLGVDILHPLGMGLPITGGKSSDLTNYPNFIRPATRYDKRQAVKNSSDVTIATDIDNRRIPEGARFRLPVATWDHTAITNYANLNGVDTDQSSVSAGARKPTKAALAKVLRCLRDYGAIIQDSAGVVTITAEHNKMFGTRYSPYATSQTPAWNNLGSVIPWDQMVQVTAPTTDISVAQGV